MGGPGVNTVHQLQDVEGFFHRLYSQHPGLRGLARLYPDWYSNPPPIASGLFYQASTATLSVGGLDTTVLAKTTSPVGLITIIQSFSVTGYDSADAGRAKLSPGALVGSLSWYPVVNHTEIGGKRAILNTNGAAGYLGGGAAFSGPGFPLLKGYSNNDTRLPPLIVRPGGSSYIQLVELPGGVGAAPPANGFGLVGEMAGYTIPIQ
jgi:hypothetical protein